MNKLGLIIFSLLTPLVMLTAGKSAMAFDLFGDGACYTTDKSGKQIPVKDANGNTPPACQQAQNEGGANNNRITGPKNVINTAANILALITGVGAVIMIIISGFKFVTAGGAAPGQRSGDPNAIKSARNTLTAAIIGLFVVALAWTIIRFATDKLIQ